MPSLSVRNEKADRGRLIRMGACRSERGIDLGSFPGFTRWHAILASQRISRG